jgi:hypothetical protein
MTLLPLRNFPRQWLTLLAVVAILGSGLGGVGRAQTSNPPVAEKVGAAATEVTKATLDNIQLLWTRIDEKRLMNRTPDELVAWAIMGILVGILLFQTGRLGRWASVLVGLAGAFLGGIVANVMQVDLGLGPVLIRYEELICSLLGGLAFLFIVMWARKRKLAKAPVK